MYAKHRCWIGGLYLVIPFGACRQRLHCQIKTPDLIGPVPCTRQDAARLIRALRTRLREVDAARNATVAA